MGSTMQAGASFCGNKAATQKRSASSAARVTFRRPQPCLHLPPTVRARALVSVYASSAQGGVAEKRETGVNKRMHHQPIYRVLLHNDDYNKREYVVQVLLQVVEGMAIDDAVEVMQEAHDTGVAMVRACPQEEAEQCCEALRLSGLLSTIEPGC